MTPGPTPGPSTTGPAPGPTTSGPAPGGLPPGCRLALDRSVRAFRQGTVLAGGHPGRVLRLTATGVTSVAAIQERPPATGAEYRLAQRLVEAGMAHPRRLAGAVGVAAGTDQAGATVVVPVRDRGEDLEACLTALGTAAPVVVVDDGSADPVQVADACHRHGATLVRREVPGGPATARNDGLATVTTELVAFVDSDCTVPAGWLDRLCWLFEDPSVGAVAPRVEPAPGPLHRPGRTRRPLRPPAQRRDRARRPDRARFAAVRPRFAAARSPLDMGAEAGEVGPRRAVRYVPTAALVVRRDALATVGGRFDADLRFGEDVDLVWQLLDAGWRVRYEPSVTVDHREPSSWPALLARRFRYGTSAAPLSRRHHDRLAPAELRPWPTVAAGVALAGHLPAAAAVTAAFGAGLARQFRPFGIPPAQAVRWSAQAVGWTAAGLGRAATMLAAPAMVAGLFGRRTRRAALCLLLIPPAVDWWQRRPRLDPVRWCLACIADDLAYGAGVWAGCLRTRTVRPLVPIVRRASDEALAPGAGGPEPR